MKNIISTIIILIITSLYFFPFEPSFLPEMNTKMAMAGIGLVVLGFQLVKGNRVNIDKNLITIVALALIVSLIGLISICYNNTTDTTYATYIISMFVWLSAANVVISCIRSLNGRVSVETICDYLIALCFIQCLIAACVDRIPSVKAFVDSLINSQGFMGKNEHRMYGIGCSLDVAGTRFSAILIMIADRLCTITKDKDRRNRVILYLTAFVFITIVGNMIARTTTIGVIVALTYIVVLSIINQKQSGTNYSFLWKWITAVVIITIIAVTFLYNTNPNIRSNIRFGFEGFFSLAETGKWEVHSNDILKNMVVFPDNLKTWVIGDGHFENPYDSEPYYTGTMWKGYYQNTDIGYLRFIFYFGIFGLIAFIWYFIKVGTTCVKRFISHRLLFAILLLLNFIIWCKVSTDIFLVFALFLCLREEEWDKPEEMTIIK